MERCSSKLFQPLQRLKIGSALAIAASKSCSLPGLTSICAISVIMCVTAFYEGTTAVSQNAVLLKPASSGQTGRPFDPPNAVLYKFRIILNFCDKADP